MGMDRRKRVTLRDVAHRANVSTAVVSYVINNGPRPTAAETRERVLKAIEDLGYQPHAFARGLREQRTQTVAYIASDVYVDEVFVSSYGAGILTGMMAELKARDRYLLVYPQVLGEDVSALARLLGSGRLDGMVVRLMQDPPATDALMEAIAEAGVPCVCIERPAAARFHFQWLTYDDLLGATTATRYLLEQGHRRIAHIHGDLRYASAQARLQGYRNMLAAAELAVDEQLIRGNSWAMADGAAATRQLLQLAEPPTAIFAASDDLAMAALIVLREQGYALPQQMAVVGFDDIPQAAQFSPPLTTIRIPLVELGRRAVDLVLKLREHEGEVASVTLPVELIRRASA